MKKLFIKIAVLSVVVLLLPFLLTQLLNHNATNKNYGSLNIQDFTIYCEAAEGTKEITFDDYLTGIVAANMPANYDMEALKAQAIICRTYSLYNLSL